MICFESYFVGRGYIAPEFIDKGEISYKSDIFSLGIIMIKLLTGSNKFNIENVRIIFLMSLVPYLKSIFTIITQNEFDFSIYSLRS